ncbi:hypothetical protein [Zoogloea sp.]|uniref:hypothetical protein n=1 Tax=Zoogloea sp. TaxID=49181 RepID=UPI0035B372AB
MSTNKWKNMDAGLLTMVAKVARNEALSAADEVSIAEFLKGYAGAGAEPGFAGGPSGDVRGSNNLRRTNWFNGRYLTAEALSRQDVYFDTRARLAAHAQMPGIAWGLGLSADGLNSTPIDSEGRFGGLPSSRNITLRRGLAFDHIGRPILVSTPFTFSIDQLIGAYRKTPQKVVGGGVDFMPCVCLVNDPAGPTGGSAALPSGPFLLVIQPGETEEGGAKVMGEICGGAASANCRADTWRGGFGLSLVRFPVELPFRQDLQSAWDLRGTLSAYFFDVFEHALWKRWDPNFATHGPFCADTGPGRHDAAAIALAMVYLGEDGSALFMDQWIPRRTICDTPAEDWHRTRFGAPPRAAAWARIHQFQCMLAESLAQRPSNADNTNLFARGFRHIPPIGFLPVKPGPADDKRPMGIPLFDKLLGTTQGAQWLVSPLVRNALGQAEDYFQGTRVITYGVVALHDDDILEDLNNVFDKDPIQLSLRPPRSNPDPATAVAGAPAPGQYKASLYQAGTVQTSNAVALPGFLGVLANLFDVLGMDELVNRRTEIVKLVVPLQGLTREHPLVGRLQEDALNQAQSWGVNPLLTAANPLGQLGTVNDTAEALAGLVARLGLDMLPRHFVVYVKQRLVLLDLLFYLLEILQFLLNFMREIQSLGKTGSTGNAQSSVSSEQVRIQYLRQPAEKRAMVEAILAEPDVQASIVRAADLSGSGIAVTTRNQAFLDKVQSTESSLANTIADPAERKRVALGQVADSYAAEYPDYQLVQVLAAVQPQHTLAVVNKLSVTRSAEPSRSLGDDLVKDGPAVFEADEARTLYVDLKSGLESRKVADYVKGSDSQLTVKEVLASTPDEAEKLLGAERYAEFRKNYQADRAAAITGAEALAKGVPSELAVKVEAGIQAGTPAESVVETLKAETATNSTNRPVLDQTANLLRITGGQAGFLKRVKRT